MVSILSVKIWSTICDTIHFLKKMLEIYYPHKVDQDSKGPETVAMRQLELKLRQFNGNE